MATLQGRLRQDLTTAMRARDGLATATLRMALAAVQLEEVAGAAARELSDDEVLAVLRPDAFAGAGREESAARERAEGELLETYLPAQVSDQELAERVRAGIAESGATSIRDMGRAMKAVQVLVAGQADGARVAAEVKRQLA